MANQAPYLHVRLADTIRHLIEESTLKAGDKVPSVRSMSRQAGVSISTVLQAYANLEADGVVVARPQSGYFVSPMAASNIRLPDRIVFSELKPKPAPAFNLWGSIYESAGNDDILPLGLANTRSELLPVKGLARAVRQVLNQSADHCTQYSFPPGEIELRRQIAAQYYLRNQEVHPDDIVITSGCTESVLLSLKATASPGDVIAVESPMYFVLLRIVKSLGMTLLEIESDPVTGMSIEALQRAIDTVRVAAVICIPNFSNPSGTLMPDTNKRQLVSLLEQHDVPLIEDDLYADLYFGDARPSSCHDFAHKGTVLSCSSFSKTLAPGYRIGWILPGRYREQVIQHKRLTSAATTTLSQLAIAQFIQSGAYQRHVRILRQTFKQQIFQLREAIARYFPEGTRISDPRGGFVLWVQLPGEIDTGQLTERAMQEKISIVPGLMFSATKRYSNFLRLCAGFTWSEAAEQGVKRLGELIRETS